MNPTNHRKHRRTRFTSIDFSLTANRVKLQPGTYRIRRGNTSLLGPNYVGSFIVNPDHTVEFYGHNLEITKGGFEPL